MKVFLMFYPVLAVLKAEVILFYNTNFISI